LPPNSHCLALSANPDTNNVTGFGGAAGRMFSGLVSGLMGGVCAGIGTGAGLAGSNAFGLLRVPGVTNTVLDSVFWGAGLIAVAGADCAGAGLSAAVVCPNSARRRASSLFSRWTACSAAVALLRALNATNKATSGHTKNSIAASKKMASIVPPWFYGFVFQAIIAQGGYAFSEII
jgi:hypothetical protein